VALRFEAPHEEENLAALELVQGKSATIRGGTLKPFVTGRWGSKWTRIGFQVPFDRTPDEPVVQESAQVMALLVEHTYPIVRSLLERSSTAEKRDFANNVLPICRMGCDDLFEKGYLFVHKATVRSNPARLHRARYPFRPISSQLRVVR
jgi:hypothetical protein